MGFRDKVALITAAGSGIGRATAEIIGAEGGAVVGVDTDKARLDALVDTIRRGGGQAEARRADGLDPAQVTEAVDGVARAHGRIDILVNAVGGSTIIARPPPPLGPAHTGAAGRRDRPHAAPAGGRGGGSSAGDLLPGFPRRGLRHRRDHRRDRRRLIGSARNSHRRKEPSMIYEIRTYRIAPGSLAEVEKRYGEAYEYRKKYSGLTAFWHREIGPLNEIVQVWGYKDLAGRARLRGEAAKDPNWPPKIREFVQAMRSEIIVPFSFVPEVRPGKLGPIFELRYYTLKPGTLPDTAKGWEAKLPERMKLSPVVLAGGVEFGRANGFVHVWAYSRLDQRARVRDEARQQGVWPPPGGSDRLLTQENKVLLPSAFSPLQ